MKRLLTTMQCDVRLQFRNGFYYATAFVVVVLTVLLNQLPDGTRLDARFLLPAILLNNLILTTFYFASGLVLLEKNEGTLHAQVVTPLKTGEYLVSKVGTLTLPTLIESVIIVMLFVGVRFDALPLVIGVVLASAIYVLAGFVSVARYASINEYLLPSLAYAAGLALPLLPYVSQWDHWVLYLHPMYGPLLLMRAGFESVSAWLLIYSVLYASLWIGLIFHWSRQAFVRHIVARTGA